MDLLRTLLTYMSLLLSSSVMMSPALTPPPRDIAGTATATPYVQTVAPTSIPTFTPAPTATAATSTTLYVGDRGENVRKMQLRLQELRYLTGRVDGVFGQQTKRAVERFQYYNRLSVDGIAGPKTLQKLYNDPNVVFSPVDVTTTPQNAVANVPVYYYSTTGALLNTDTVPVRQGSAYITPNPQKVPANHTLRSQRSVRVTVNSRGVATPSSVVYTYEPNAPSVVSVPVYYRLDNGDPLHTDYVNLRHGQSTTVTANDSRVPAGYRLITARQINVSVSQQGYPSPTAVIFVYQKPQAVNVTVPVLYRNPAGDLIGSETKSFGVGNFAINANDAAVPSGYTLRGARTQYVNISAAGTATPSSVTFTYETKAVTVTVPVEYREQGTDRLLHSDTFSAQQGNNVIYANDGFVPGYNIVSARQVTITVDAGGTASPAKAVFTYKKQVSVTLPIRYVDDKGNALTSTSQVLPEGTRNIMADDSLVPGYILQSPRNVSVTVSAAGVATPPEVVFTYAKPTTPVPPTPTPTPAPTPEPPPTPSPAPVTEAPVTEAPVTEAPVTEAPVTEAPVTEAPVTEPPVTEAPVTEAPVMNIPTLPNFVKTKPNEGSFPVYTGPGTGYYRVGNATLSGNGTIRVYGQENGWALIGYGLSNGGYRIGFVEMAAIPDSVSPPNLRLVRQPKNNVSTSIFVDDPIVTTNQELQKRFEGGGHPFTVLAYLNDFFAYVEVNNFEGSGTPARGFVSRRSLGL